MEPGRVRQTADRQGCELAPERNIAIDRSLPNEEYFGVRQVVSDAPVRLGSLVNIETSLA